MKNTGRICALLSAAMLICGMPIYVSAEEIPSEFEETVIEAVEDNALNINEEVPESEDQDKYGITLENSIIVDEEGNELSITEADEGTVITLRFMPSDEERDIFLKWNVSTESGNIINVTDNSFVMPAESVKVVAEYEKQYLISVIDGTADLEKAKEGEKVTVTVLPLTVKA